MASRKPESTAQVAGHPIHPMLIPFPVATLVSDLIFLRTGNPGWATASFWLLGAALVVRGFGLGFTMMPAMAAAYATIESDQVPRATPMLNVLQRVGGSLGTAVLAVVLQRQIVAELSGAGGGGASLGAIPDSARARLAEPLSTAFAHTYWWAMGMTALALIPAAVLAVTERRTAREKAAAEASLAPETAIGPVPEAATQRAPGRSPRPGRAPARLR